MFKAKKNPASEMKAKMKAQGNPNNNPLMRFIELAAQRKAMGNVNRNAPQAMSGPLGGAGAGPLGPGAGPLGGGGQF